MRFYYPFLAGVLLMIGITLLATQLIGVDQAAKSSKWQAVSAQIIDRADAEKQGAVNDRVDEAIRSWMLPAMFTIPRIGFTYKFNGTAYSSINYSFSIDPLGPNEQQLQELYAPGMLIQAFVDPENPKNAVLRPGFNEHFILLITTSILFIMGGFVWLTRPVKENVLR